MNYDLKELKKTTVNTKYPKNVLETALTGINITNNMLENFNLIIGVFSEKERLVLEKRYKNNLKMLEIADQLDTTAASVSSARNRAIRKLWFRYKSLYDCNLEEIEDINGVTRYYLQKNNINSLWYLCRFIRDNGPSWNKKLSGIRESDKVEAERIIKYFGKYPKVSLDEYINKIAKQDESDIEDLETLEEAYLEELSSNKPENKLKLDCATDKSDDFSFLAIKYLKRIIPTRVWDTLLGSNDMEKMY